MTIGCAKKLFFFKNELLSKPPRTFYTDFPRKSVYDFQRKHGHDIDCHVLAPASTCSNTRASTCITTRACTCHYTRARLPHFDF